MATFGPYPATVLGWHDGDTCHLDIDLGFAIHLVAEPTCRVYGINAPELSTPEGKDALAHVLGLAPPGSKVTVVSHGWDKYGGRFDGELTRGDGVLIGPSMVNDGFAVERTY